MNSTNIYLKGAPTVYCNHTFFHDVGYFQSQDMD